MQRAEHPADRVAQLAIGLDGVLQDFGADALVVGIVGGADPEPQDIGAGIASMTFCGSTVLPSDFDILRPFSSSVKPWVSTTSIRRAAAGAAAFQQRGLEPAAVLVAAFQIHHGILRRRRPCA